MAPRKKSKSIECGYPGGIPQPGGPFRLLEGTEYESARNAANQANQALHRADPSLAGTEIHEIQPVKFGGNPIDPAIAAN